MSDRKEPIFIVGNPRSGTTLLAALLSSHSELDCGPETHFFCFLSKKKKREILKSKNWPNLAFIYITSLKIADNYVYKTFGLTKKEIFNFLCKNNPSIKATLESLTKLHAQKKKKLRWIEKTPNHLLFIPEIRKHFKESFIIRVIRDVRDSAISMTRVPWGSKSLLYNLIKLNEWYYLSQNHIKNDSRIFVFKYESLLEDYINYLNKTCNFIGIQYEHSMLKFQEQASSLFGENEWWKQQVVGPLDKSRLYVWKRVLDENTKLLSTYISMTILKNFGYDIDIIKEPKETIFFYPMTENFIKENQNTFLYLAKENIRLIGSANIDSLNTALDIEKPTKLIILLPMYYYPPPFTTLQRSKFLIKFLNSILRFKKRGIPILYYDKQLNISSKLDITVKFMVNLLAELEIKKLSDLKF